MLSAAVYMLLAFTLFYGSLKIYPVASEGADVALVVCYRHANIELVSLVIMNTLFLFEAWLLLEAVAFDLSKLK